MHLGIPELLIVFCICGLLGLIVAGGPVAFWVLVIRPKPGKQ